MTGREAGHLEKGREDLKGARASSNSYKIVLANQSSALTSRLKGFSGFPQYIYVEASEVKLKKKIKHVSREST